MGNLFVLALQTMRMKKRRTLFSVLGVVAGVALLVSIMVFQGKMDDSLNRQYQARYGDEDLMVGYRHEAKLLNGEQVQEIQSTDGIAETGQAVVNPILYLHLQPNDPAARLMFIGVDNSRLTRSNFKYETDLSAGETILSAGAAQQLQAKIGQDVQIPLPHGKSMSAKVVGIQAASVTTNGAQSPEIVFLPIAMVQREFGLNGVNLVLIKLQKDADKAKVAIDLPSRVAPDLDVDRLEDLDAAKRNAQSLKVMGYGLGVLAVLASGLFMISNFQLSLKERVREFATLRAVGARAGQLFWLVTFEVLISGCIGILIGLFGGVGLAEVLSGWLASFLQVSIANTPIPWGSLVLMALLIWIGIFTISWWPLRQTLYIMPIQAVREMEEDSRARGTEGKRGFFFLVMIGLGAALMAIGSNLSSDSGGGGRMLTCSLGGICFVIGVFLGITKLTKPLLRVLSPIVERIGGRMSFVAVQNQISDRKQSAMTIMVIAISMTILIALTSVMWSAQTASKSRIHNTYRSGDIAVTSSDFDKPTLFYEQSKMYQSIPGVESVLPYSGRHPSQLTGYDFSKADPSWYSQNKAQPFEHGLNQSQVMMFYMTDLHELQKRKQLPPFSVNVRDAVVFPRDYAANLGVQVGNVVTVNAIGGAISGQTRLQVAAIVDQLPGPAEAQSVYVDWSNKSLQGIPMNPVETFVVQSAPGHQADVMGTLNELKQQNSSLQVQTEQEALRENQMAFGQQTVLIGSVVAVILLVGLLGLINTVSASLHAKRREYAVLRAVHITRGQLVQIIVTQTTLYAVLAVIFGLLSGYAMAYSLLSGIGVSLPAASIPWTMHGELVALVIGIVLLIGLLMSWRFGKRSILQNLSQE